MLQEVRRNGEMMHRGEHRRTLGLECQQRLEACATFGALRLYSAALVAPRNRRHVTGDAGCTVASTEMVWM